MDSNFAILKRSTQHSKPRDRAFEEAEDVISEGVGDRQKKFGEGENEN